MMSSQRKHTCSLCLNTSDHPFGLGFDTTGVCLGCITHREKEKYRDANFEKLIDRIVSKKSETYDCVIPVRGDADDYFVVSELLQRGLTPLITHVNSHFLNDIGWFNLQNLIDTFDLDSVSFNPNFIEYKRLVNYAMATNHSVFLPYKYLFHSFAVRQAVAKKIPFIVYGENQPIEQCGNFSNLDFPEKSSWLHKVFDFDGKSLSEFLSSGGPYAPEHLEFYDYPKSKARAVTGIYLSNYISWDSLRNNQIALRHDFKPTESSRTFDSFHRAGVSGYYDIHDFMRLKNCGYLKVRDHLNREIRYGRLSRSEAQTLYGQYLKVPFDFEPFFDWLDISQSGRAWLEGHMFSDVNREREAISEIMLPGALKKLTKHRKFLPTEQYLSFSKQLDVDVSPQNKVDIS